MKMVHELPGTTFSNTQDRGNYNSEKLAILTLRELEKWLALAISTYHEGLHSTLLEPPIACWKKSIAASTVFAVTDEKSFLIDFLPVIRRCIVRTGFVIDHITYYADLLKPWIASRERLGKFVIRRDPRDLSRIWVLDPRSNQYFEIPYRSLSNPGVTLWEHRRAVQLVRERGRAQVNEAAIFRMIGQMREITEAARIERKRVRRDNARRAHLAKERQPVLLTPPDTTVSKDKLGKRFDDIEEW